MKRHGRLSHKAIAATGAACLLIAGTVAAQSGGEPWWIEADIASPIDVVTQDGSVAISTLGFSGSLAKAKANYPETGEYIGCTMTALPDNGQLVRCAARTASGETLSCESLYLGSELDFRKALTLTAAQSINADSFIVVSVEEDGEDCLSITVSNSSADFLVLEGGGTGDGGVESCNMSNSVNLGAFGGSPKSVPNDGCAVVTQFAQPFFQYGPNRTMQLQNPSGSTGYPLQYEYKQSCTGASGTGTFNATWHDQFLPGMNDQCPLYIKLEGNGSGNISLSYF